MAASPDAGLEALRGLPGARDQDAGAELIGSPRARLPDTPPMPNTDITSPEKSRKSTAAPAIDWFSEGEKSVAEIANRRQPSWAAESPPPPTGSAPWDPHPHVFETTGHGFIVRIPVRIPGDIIDHCFGNFDLGQNQGGKWEKYKLECALKKQPARGDLFDSLRQPSEPLNSGARRDAVH